MTKIDITTATATVDTIARAHGFRMQANSRYTWPVEFHLNSRIVPFEFFGGEAGVLAAGSLPSGKVTVWLPGKKAAEAFEGKFRAIMCARTGRASDHGIYAL